MLKTNGRGLARVALAIALTLVASRWPVAAQGLVDHNFDPSVSGGRVLALAVQPDGKILIGGEFTAVSGQSRSYIARVSAEGEVDLSFNVTLPSPVWALALQSDGKILVGTESHGLVRLDSIGSLEANVPVNGAVYAIAVQPDGKILFGGSFTSVGSALRSSIARIDQNGMLDAFDASLQALDESNQLVLGRVSAIALQSDGKVLIGGDFDYVNTVAREDLARLHAGGTLDMDFSPSVSGIPVYGVPAIAVQPDGKILVGGATGLARLDAKGTPDASFSAVSEIPDVFSIVQQPNGGTLIGGGPAGMARLRADGSRDTGFVVSVSGPVQAIALQSDGKIVIGGDFDLVDNSAHSRVARLHARDDGPIAHPTTPSNVQAAVNGNNVLLSWTAPTGGTPFGYLVEAGSASGLTDVVVAPTGSTATQLAATAPAGVYYVRVRALYQTGPSAPSNEVQVRVGVTGPPGPPGPLQVMVDGTTVTLTWGVASGAVSAYLLEAGTAPSLANVVTVPVNSTTLSATGVPFGTYYVRVRAIGPGGVSLPTSDATVTVGSACVPPSPPQNLTSMVAGGLVTLVWSAPGTGTSPITYTLVAGTSSGGSDVGVFPVGPTTTIQAAAPPGTYHVRAAASNACGTSSASNEALVIVGG